MQIKSVKIKISKNKKKCFFLMSQGSIDPKIRFLGQKVCSVAHVQTDGQTDTQTDTKVNTEDILLRVSGIFPSTHHQGSVQFSGGVTFDLCPFECDRGQLKIEEITYQVHSMHPALET